MGILNVVVSSPMYLMTFDLMMVVLTKKLSISTPGSLLRYVINNDLCFHCFVHTLCLLCILLNFSDTLMESHLQETYWTVYWIKLDYLCVRLLPADQIRSDWSAWMFCLVGFGHLSWFDHISSALTLIQHPPHPPPPSEHHDSSSSDYIQLTIPPTHTLSLSHTHSPTPFDCN